MMAGTEWIIAPELQPKSADYVYDLNRALSSVVGVRALVPEDAATADALGTERMGHGVIIRENGLILTIGYLITEAETVWLKLSDGRSVSGHVLAFDQETGFGLVQPLTRLGLPFLELGESAGAQVGDPVVVAGAGGRTHSVAAKIAAKQSFAGYWEYYLNEAIFTAPSHPNWGGTALIGSQGELLGIGSLQLERMRDDAKAEPINMMVPIDVLKPVFDDLLKFGRTNRPVRPWLGIYSTEIDDHIVIAGVAKRGPARRAELKTGDVVLAVGDHEVRELADFYRRVWSLGSAGVNVPLTIHREGDTFDVTIRSGERSQFLKQPNLH
ncbi:MAG TPA: S1C family serine protease [Xanthobacteraceae bacterium]|nr:S1C family serine protease [Xanthobacteraceae bacterium]